MTSDVSHRTLAQYEAMAEALLDAYRLGTPEAMGRHYRYTWHRRAWQGMRRYVQLDLGKRPASPEDDVEISLDDARFLVATEYGFQNWQSLQEFAESERVPSRAAAKPVRLVNAVTSGVSETVLTSRDWDEVLRRLAEQPAARLCAEGQMTDAVLADVAAIESITELDLSASHELTDEGLRHLAKLPQLRVLNLSKTSITDHGLRVLRDLPALESLSVSLTRITDEGAAHLAACPALVRVDLAWTATGDGALRALAGKAALRSVSTGHGVTDAGLPILHDIPAFKTWCGEEPEMALFTESGSPTSLWLRGSFTDRGMEQLRGLDGLFDLNLDDTRLAITAGAMAPLVSLAASRPTERGCERRLDAVSRRDAAPALPADSGHDRERRRVRGVEPVALDRVALGAPLREPSDARLSRARRHAGAQKPGGQLPERRGARDCRPAVVPVAARADAHGRAGRKLSPHRKL